MYKTASMGSVGMDCIAEKDEVQGDGVPVKFICPILGTIMDSPVRIETAASTVVVDFSTIIFDGSAMLNPYDRQPLGSPTCKMIFMTRLAEEIAEWKILNPDIVACFEGPPTVSLEYSPQNYTLLGSPTLANKHMGYLFALEAFFGDHKEYDAPSIEFVSNAMTYNPSTRQWVRGANGQYPIEEFVVSFNYKEVGRVVVTAETLPNFNPPDEAELRRLVASFGYRSFENAAV